MSQALPSRQDQRLVESDKRCAAARLPGECPTIIPLPCTQETSAARCLRRTRMSTRGFTLIEMLVAMVVAGILSSVAYPSFQGQVHKVRRSDVLVSMMQVQLAQERWRSNGSSYGTLAEVGVASASPAGYYNLRVTSNGASGYEVLATATGSQARDTACRNLRLNVAQSNVTYSSGPDASTDNPAALNRQCWNL